MKLNGLLIGLSLALTACMPADDGGLAGKPRIYVEVSEDGYRLHARNAPLQDVVESLQRVAPLTVRSSVSLTNNITTDYVDAELATLVDDLFRGYNIIVRQSSPGVLSVEVLQPTIAPEQTVEQLLSATHHPSAAIRIAALKEIESYPLAASLPGYHVGITDPDADVRMATVNALEERLIDTQEPEVVLTLLSIALDDEATNVRDEAALALAGTGEDGLARLEAAAADEHAPSHDIATLLVDFAAREM